MATKQISAHDSFREVESHEEIRRDAHERISLEPGDAYPQGDLILWCLDKLPDTAEKHEGRKLAPGTTQGSRHFAEGECELATPKEESALEILHRLFPKTKTHVQFFGPSVLATGEWTMTHPEHGNRTFGPGNYVVTYQKVWAKEIRRVND